MAKQVKRVPQPGAGAAAKPTAGPRTRKTNPPAAPVMITDEQIRQRAYQIYLARNGGQGDALSDWKQAERELRTEMGL